MFKLSQALVVGMFGAGVLLAAPIPCITDTAANFVTNFSSTSSSTGCTIVSGGTTILFNGFSFIQAATGPTTGGASNQFNLTPLSDVHGLGFDIVPTTAFTASATGVNDFELGFVATVIGGPNLISDLFLSMTGSAGASGVGGGRPGSDILVEAFCRGGSLPPGSCPAGQGGPQTSTLTITGPATGTTVTSNPTFAPTTALSVLKDVQLNGNNGATASTVTDVRNQVSITGVPEPSAAWLSGIGLGLIGLSLGRRLKRNA